MSSICRQEGSEKSLLAGREDQAAAGGGGGARLPSPLQERSLPVSELLQPDPPPGLLLPPAPGAEVILPRGAWRASLPAERLEVPAHVPPPHQPPPAAAGVPQLLLHPGHGLRQRVRVCGPPSLLRGGHSSHLRTGGHQPRQPGQEQE